MSSHSSDDGPTTVALRGARLLRRTDGRRWSVVLEPLLRDIADPVPRDDLLLDELDWIISRALAEFERFPFPEAIIHLGPEQQSQVDPVAFASVVVAHRAERLLQLTELAAGALDNLEHRSLQLAAAAARCLFEIGATSYDVHNKLLDTWRSVHGSKLRVTTAVSTSDSAIWQALWTARLGSRNEEDAALGWPEAVNVMTRLAKLGRGNEDFANGVNDIYAALCEATHPNLEAQGVFWRRGEVGSDGRQRLYLEPSASESPIKLAIVDAVRLAHWLIVPFVRDLWWIAAETASFCRFSRVDAISLGLPFLGGRNELCCCGSGRKAKICDHPEPTALSQEKGQDPFG